jgi:hypothetical protein
MDRDFVLLGIKYEAARVGGVDEAGLARIKAQIRDEAGEGWEEHPMVVRGRDAVRAEHGLPPLGRPREPGTPPARRSLLGRLFGGRR